MTTRAHESGVDPCGCCETAPSMSVHYNNPGQPVLSYRLGDHGVFLRRMLARLSTETISDGPHQGKRPLEILTVRSSDDPAIALLDAWAMVADLLTFYQERIANEGFLRTATERRSVLELARTIGYELNPGVAAGAFLAFTLEDAPGAPSAATIPKGARVQSVPAPGKLPQAFETSREIRAYADWNELRPRLSRPQTLAIHRSQLYLVDGEGLLTGAEEFPVRDLFLVGDDVPFPDGVTQIPGIRIDRLCLKGAVNNLAVGDLLLLVGKKKGVEEYSAFIRPILEVEIDARLDRTWVVLDKETRRPPFALSPLKPVTLLNAGLSFTAKEIKNNVLGLAQSEKNLSALLAVNSWERNNLVRHVAAAHSSSEPLPPNQGVFTFRERVGFFGHNAPKWDSLPFSQREGEYVPTRDNRAGTWVDGAYRENWDRNGWEIWRGYPDKKYLSAGGPDVHLERKVDKAAKGGWVVLESTAAHKGYTAYRIMDVHETSVTGFALSSKATGLKLADVNGGELGGQASGKPAELKVRSTTAHVQSERLELAQLPIEDNLEEEEERDGEVVKTGVIRLMLDGLVLGLQVDQPVAISGEQVDARGVVRREIAILSDIVHSHGYTVLFFHSRLQHRYIRKTVTINANVVYATHGETVREVLGSGDGTRANQRFSLKKPPLTFVSAPTPSGNRSTLMVQVDGVQWKEAPSLYGLDGLSESYIIRIDNEGKADVVFGDGEKGARLPSGRENIQATYRSGIGPDGEVDAESLTLLLTRPLGVRSVSNPLAASGSEAPETLDQARANAPLTVLTMDRIVSVQDFENFARAFAGVGKAQAGVLWNGETNLVHITVATASGKPVDSASDLYKNLIEAINAVRDPVQQVRVDSFQPLFFNLHAKVLVHPRHVPATVLANVHSTLQTAFAFENRAFGQSVAAAEVVNVIQKTPGVIAADLDKLYLVTDAGGPDQVTPASILPANRVNWPKGASLRPAELLLINPSGITIEEMKP